jgi:hypothetical protein
MRTRILWKLAVVVFTGMIGLPGARAGSLTYSHASSALPGAPGPSITLLSITGTNDGTNLSFTLTFANPTIKGPSSANTDAIYGFINLDTDNNAATGVTGAQLDSGGLEPGFGRYSPGTQGIDAYINLSSEGDPIHGVPGLVDLVTTSGFTPIDTIPVTYTNQVGTTPSTLSFSIPLSILLGNQFSVADTGNFSVSVGNLDHATDFLPSAAVPEPSSITLLALGAILGLVTTRRCSGLLARS